MTICPFCGCDPFHYENNGLGMEAVAVTCCDLGHDYFMGNRKDEPPDTVVIGWGDFQRLADILRAMRLLGMNPDFPVT